MKISVALATHNGSIYLENQLASLLHQTLPPYEIIISDDGSSDGTCELVENYSKIHKNITLIHCKNQGINANFQNALAACRGEYIALCDQDDLWAEDKLENLAAQCTDKTLLVYGKSVLIDQDGQQMPVTAEKYLGFHTYRTGHIPLYFLFSNCISGHAMMINKNLVNHILPFPDNCVYDHWIALVASAKSDIVYTADAITFHRIHAANATNNQEKNRADKKIRIKPSKIKRYNMQQAALLLRLKKTMGKDNNLYPAEHVFLSRLAELIVANSNHFFSLQLFWLLKQQRYQLFHGNLLRECRNRALGEKYFRLLDRFSKI